MRIAMGVNMRVENAAAKKSVNVTLAPEILDEARKLKLNISAVLTEALIEKFRENARAEWLRDNQEKIAVLNEFVEEHGSFSDFQRTF
ncbi:type II toxin-antitoxin system CcdA family antitoxin [Cedecea neteri]|uniref:type II toxin-antitoxin system CcdA family antitoxin n=1 Tax=Cedecea neteri TaxID=158822 RepID=UPI002898274E|nr:type II toxin-antitoxin system CcdA family antitoxin [Cedecea neteri]